MNMSLPGGRRGQALALALTIVLAATFWVAVASPLIEWYEHRGSVLAERQILARHMTDIAGQLDELRRQVAGAASRGPPALAVFAGDTDAISGAALQGLINDLAENSGATLTSAEMLPAYPVGAHRRIGLRVEVYAADWPTIVRLLQSIEQATPRMLVDDLQIHGMPRRKKEEGPPIDASFTVFAFRAAEVAKSG